MTSHADHLGHQPRRSVAPPTGSAGPTVSDRMRRVLDRYSRPSTPKAVWQLVNTLVPCLALWVLMFFTVNVSYALTLGIALLTAGFLVRTFIIFHDCGHGSFLRSRTANRIIGFVTGVLTLTPSHRWWADHARHHATTGNIDRRGVGDVWMMTVDQYRRAPAWKRLWYRIYRHPVFMFLVGPFFVFVFVNRLPKRGAKRRERSSVIWTNLTLVAIWVTLGLTVGMGSYLKIHVPVLAFSGMAGLWLFYVQHNYEFAYWRPNAEHDYAAACLVGSSYYQLPRMLQWFSGNIGFHHIHHLSPRIPNYFLQSCHRSLPELDGITTLTVRTSLRTLSLRLWDEASDRMISFGEFERRLRRQEDGDRSRESPGGRRAGTSS